MTPGGLHHEPVAQSGTEACLLLGDQDKRQDYRSLHGRPWSKPLLPRPPVAFGPPALFAHAFCAREVCDSSSTAIPRCAWCCRPPHASLYDSAWETASAGSTHVRQTFPSSARDLQPRRYQQEDLCPLAARQTPMSMTEFAPVWHASAPNLANCSLFPLIRARFRLAQAVIWHLLLGWSAENDFHM